MDRYRNYQELARNETAFSIEYLDRDSDVTIIAPHGGNIEPNTSEIAALIAGDDYNLFCFNGFKSDNNRKLHITSHRFDHDQALSLTAKASFVIAVHGCTINRPIIYLGGLDAGLIAAISRHLNICNISNSRGNQRFAGTHPHNICNRGLRGRGVQLEISRGVRDSGSARGETAAAVRSAITELQRNRERQGSYLSHNC